MSFSCLSLSCLSHVSSVFGRHQKCPAFECWCLSMLNTNSVSEMHLVYSSTSSITTHFTDNIPLLLVFPWVTWLCCFSFFCLFIHRLFPWSFSSRKCGFKTWFLVSRKRFKSTDQMVWLLCWNPSSSWLPSLREMNIKVTSFPSFEKFLSWTSPCK